MPSCTAIRFLPFESLDAWEAPLKERFELDYRNAPVEGIDHNIDPDLLVVLGGPIGANDGGDYPFVDSVIELLRSRIEQDRPTLGICLGAQLMARAMGAEVNSGDQAEIGWSELTIAPDGMLSPLKHLDGVAVFHWHSDRFDLPENARLLAGTPACAHQAFDRGSNVLGMQFHPEVSSRQLEAWYVGHHRSLQAAENLDVHELRNAADEYSNTLMVASRRMLDDWLAAAGF